METTWMLSNMVANSEQIRKIFIEDERIIYHLILNISKKANTTFGSECISFVAAMVLGLSDSEFQLFIGKSIKNLNYGEFLCDDAQIVDVLFNCIFEVMGDLVRQDDQLHSLLIIDQILYQGQCLTHFYSGKNIYADNIMDRPGWIEAISDFQNSKSQNLFEEAQRIINEYFPEFVHE